MSEAKSKKQVITFKPLGDRVFVEIIKDYGSRAKSGILHQPNNDSGTLYGKVIAAGKGLFTNSGEFIKTQVSEGDIVLLEGTGIKHREGDKKYNIYRESEIISIIETSDE